MKRSKRCGGSVGQGKIERLESRLLMAVDFLAKTDFAVGSGVSSVTSAQVNSGDSNADIVVTNRGSGSVTVRAGDGTGGFFSGSSFTAGADPASVVVAPFISTYSFAVAAVANGSANTVSLLFGSGNIAFSPPEPILSVGTNPTCVILADVNKDGRLDIITSNAGSANVTVLRQDEFGRFLVGDTSNYAAGAGASSVAAGDANGDTFPDLFVSNATDGTVSVLLNNGNGTFAAQTTYATGSTPKAVAVADLDGDGKLDLLTADMGANQISVRKGNGNGTFGTRQTFSTGTAPVALATADIDGDGNQDVVVVNSTANTVSVFSGNGTLTLPAAVASTVGAGPNSVVIADQNKDGKADLVVGNGSDSTVSVLIQNPATTALLEPVTPLRGVGAVNLVVTYTDSPGVDASTLDGSDLLITGPNGFSRNATLVSAGTNIGFSRAVTYQIAPAGGSFTLADNGTYTVSLVAGQVKDTFGTAAAAGVLGTFVVGIDTARPTATLAAVPTLQTTGTVTLFVTYSDDLAGLDTTTIGSGDLLVTGPNGFSRSVTRIFSPSNGGLSVVAPYSIAPASGSFTPLENGTYTVSLVAGSVADLGGNTVLAATLGTFVVNAGTKTTPTFGTAANLAMGTKPQSVITADVNGDGKADLISANRDSNNVSVRLGNGNGTFQNAVNVAVGTTPRVVVAADLDGDLVVDLLTSNSGSQNLTFLKGVGDGSFAAGVAIAVGGAPFGIAVGRVNSDGIADIVVAAGNANAVLVLLGTGGGAFASPVAYASGLDTSFVALADVNGDQRTDVVAVNNTAGTVSVLLGNASGNGTLGAATAYAVGSSPSGVAVADLNGDGVLDLAVTNQSGNNVSVLLGTGGGVFGTQTTFPTQTAPASVVAVDMDLDGDKDLVVANTLTGNVTVLLNNGDGTFGNQQHLTVGNEPQTAAVADLNADGKPDIVTANTSALSNNVSVLLSNWTTPTVSIGAVSPGQRKTGVSSFQIVFSQAVTGFDLADLSLRRNGGANLLTGSQTLTTADNITFTLGNVVGLTSADGGYVLAVVAGGIGGAGILNSQFNPLVAGAQQTFTVDGTAPTAQLAAVPTVTRDGEVDFVVTFSDASGIDAATLGTGAGNPISVTGPNGFSSTAFPVTGGLNNGSPRTVTYRLLRPNGGFSSASNGTYTVSLLGGRIADTFGNQAVAAALGTFVVDIDGDGPTAVLSPVATVTTPGAVTFSVTYTDRSGVQAAALGNGDIRVTGPNGFSALATLVSTGLANGSPLTAVYRVSAGAGGFKSAGNGTYQVSLVAGEVTDTRQNAAAATALGTFTLALETGAPSAAVGTVGTIGRSTTADLVVTYTDASGVDIATLDGADLLVTGPNGFARSASLVSTSASSDGTQVVARYRIGRNAGGAAFLAADNGTYSIGLAAGAVADGLGNAVTSQTLGSFGLAVVAPTGTFVSADSIVDIGTAFSTVVVRFSDDTGLNTATLSRDDLVRVTAPNGQGTFATFLGLTTDGATVTGRYRYAAPRGVFAAADNGTYTVAVVDGVAADADGNTVAGASGGVFTSRVLDSGPDLTATLLTKLPSKVVGGDRTPQSVSVRVRNVGTKALAKTDVVVGLYLSADDVLNTGAGGDLRVGSATLKKLTLGTGKTDQANATITFRYPTSVQGDLRLIARVDDGTAIAETKESNNTALSSGRVSLRQPFVDFSATVKPQTIIRSKAASGGAVITATLKNGGNVTPSEKNAKVKTVTVRLTATPIAGGSSISLGDFAVTFDPKFKNGGTTAVRLALKSLPKALVNGQYSLAIMIDPKNATADVNLLDNLVTALLTVK